jgi:hypothetical protein
LTTMFLSLSFHSVSSSGSFQTSKKASPIFLLAHPAYESTIACTISPI